MDYPPLHYMVLLNRVRRIRGQVEADERALEREIGCADVVQLIAAARGAINGPMAADGGGDGRPQHVIDPGRKSDSERDQATKRVDRRGALTSEIGELAEVSCAPIPLISIAKFVI
jgi:hypothetical protein